MFQVISFTIKSNSQLLIPPPESEAGVVEVKQDNPGAHITMMRCAARGERR
jgi:hypothetical protein